MALTLNVDCRSAILDSGLNAAFNSGKLCFYTGAKPATANLVPSGTKIFEEDLPADAFGAAAAGAIAKAGTWSSVGLTPGGTAGYFRFKAASDDDSEDGAYARIDGTITTVAVGTGDLLLDNTSIATDQVVTVNTFTFTMPAGS
jgi:hypothetical protein